MDDMISFRAAINAIRMLQTYKLSEGDEMLLVDIAEVQTALTMLPSAQRKGKWIAEQIGIKLASYRCSECGRVVWDDTGYDVVKDYPFCHCGAMMKGGEDEDS